MKIAGIVAEYNPFHNGHAHHIQQTRAQDGRCRATHVVAVMSGHFVQRGEPALLPKPERVRMALAGGADLVLELPLPWSLASAEGFAYGAVSILDALGCVEVISFGSECGDAAALEKARAEGRDAVHVRAWLALPAACPSQSHITLDRFTETPGHIAAEDAPQRTVCWEADLTENRTFGAEYSYRETAVYADPLSFTPDAEQPDFYTGEEAPHIVFTPYLRALAAQLTEGITSPAEKAKRIYDYVTLNVRYHFQPSYFVHESIAENCARSRRGDCGIMALTFITLCRIAGIPARWESGFAVAPGDAGCHDWARFYVAPKGWMYADCSYGASMARRGDEVLRRHYFGSLDTGRMVANSAFEAPFDPPMLGFRSDPYDNQSGEMEADGVGLYGDDTVTTKEVLKFEEVE